MNVNVVGAAGAPIPNKNNQQTPKNAAVEILPKRVEPKSTVQSVDVPEAFSRKVFTENADGSSSHKAVGAYLAVQNSARREQVTSMFGLDVYA